MSESALQELELVRAFEAGELPEPTGVEDPALEAYRRLLHHYRHRKPRRLIDAEFESFEACAAVTGIPEAALARAAARGCEAVADGRVRLRPLIEWHFEHELPPAPPTPAERIEHGRLQKALLRLQLGCARGRYIPVRHVRRLFGEVRESVRRVFALRREAAPGFQGQSEEAIAQRLSLDAEVLEAQARMVDEAVRFWRHRARQGKGAPRATRSELED